MMPKEIHSYVSSSTVREVARCGGNVAEFVPPLVVDAIRDKVKQEGGVPAGAVPHRRGHHGRD
jgi:pantetheine-phosphate adenylyltransferase